MSELITKQIQIYGRSYRVKVKPEEISQLDSSVEKLNLMIQKFAGSYDGDVQDFMAMTALFFASEHEKSMNTKQELEILNHALFSLENELNTNQE